MQCGWCLRDFDEHELTEKYYVKKPGGQAHRLKVCKERCAPIVNRSFAPGVQRVVLGSTKKGVPD